MRFYLCTRGNGCCSSHDSGKHFFSRLIYMEIPHRYEYISILQRIDPHAVRGSGYVCKPQVKELMRREVL